MGEYSDFLFARPSFLEGVARILDLGNTLNEYNKSIDADATALTMDMYAVGDDLREAIAHVDHRNEHDKKERTGLEIEWHDALNCRA